MIGPIVLAHLSQVLFEIRSVYFFFLRQRLLKPIGRRDEGLRGAWPDLALSRIEGLLEIFYHYVEGGGIEVVEDVPEDLCLPPEMLVHGPPYEFHGSVL